PRLDLLQLGLERVRLELVLHALLVLAAQQLLALLDRLPILLGRRLVLPLVLELLGLALAPLEVGLLAARPRPRPRPDPPRQRGARRRRGHRARRLVFERHVELVDD